jgi:hypothetical protein
MDSFVVADLVEAHARSLKVAGARPDEVTEIFQFTKSFQPD